jgi:hypothetical protein
LNEQLSFDEVRDCAAMNLCEAQRAQPWFKGAAAIGAIVTPLY